MAWRKTHNKFLTWFSGDLLRLQQHVFARRGQIREASAAYQGGRRASLFGILALLYPCRVAAGTDIARPTDRNVISLHDFMSDEAILDSQSMAPRLDHYANLKAFALAMATGENHHFKIPSGRYLCSGEIVAASELLGDVLVEADGAEIVITSPRPEPSKRYFCIANTKQHGGKLVVRGLAMRHNRPAGRVANTDMMRFSGFDEYYLEDLHVASSDNMGITIGRGDPSGYCPRSVRLIRPRVGGRYEREQHAYASIGDSGIWIVNAPAHCEIIAPVVESTGDDGILVGETVSPKAGDVHIIDALVSDCGGNGICVSVPRGRITGHIKKTNQSGVSLQHLQGTEASDFSVAALIEDAGQLRVGDVGMKMIQKWNPWGVWIYQSGRGGRVDLSGTVVRRSLGSGVNIQTYGDGDLRTITGNVTLESVCQDSKGDPGWGVDQAALRRSGTGKGSVSDVTLTLKILRSHCPWVLWLINGPQADSRIAVTIDADDSPLHDAYGEGGRARIRLRRVDRNPHPGLKDFSLVLPEKLMIDQDKLIKIDSNISVDEVSACFGSANVLCDKAHAHTKPISTEKLPLL
jgi:hypothetical protein